MKLAEMCKVTVPKDMVYFTPKGKQPTKRAKVVSMVQDARQMAMMGSRKGRSL